MSRPIDADALISDINSAIEYCERFGFATAHIGVLTDVLKRIDAQPTMEHREQKTAYWIKEAVNVTRPNGRLGTDVYFTCSNCVSASDSAKKYCPECGAKILGVKSRYDK